MGSRSDEGPFRYELGTVEASEALLADIYVDLRRKLKNWANITHQTPQARMGYIGQHLTSVVTGYRGKKSGARGDDLLITASAPGEPSEVGEIKTCYRVDQLGRCLTCGAGVASTELYCNALLDDGRECKSTHILRNDDSKWLLTIKDQSELKDAFRPKTYYLVLFDFADMSDPREINVRIYELDPRSKGFAYCVVDYFFNIKSKSASGAPFNLWPFSPKWYAMQPVLVYASLIGADDSITTQIFPGKRGTVETVPCPPLQEFSPSKNVTFEAVLHIAQVFGVGASTVQQAGGRRAGGTSTAKGVLLNTLQEVRERQGWDDAALADALADGIYRTAVKDHLAFLPESIRQAFPSSMDSTL